MEKERPARSRSRYDAVVVGSGHNGLVAAAYLARAGQSVLVLERSSTLGGATASERIFPGVDARLSRYAYLVSLLPPRIVADLGLRFTSRRRAILSCTPYIRSGRHEALLLSNLDQERSRTSFVALAGEGDWRDYLGLLELERALAARVWPSLLQPLRSRQEWKRSLATAAERAAWDAFVERPLGDALERYVADDLVRGLLFTDAKIGVLTHPSDGTLLQNRCFILHVIGKGTGDWEVPVGGMGALVEDLTAAGRAAGAELEVDATVRRVHPGTPNHTVVYQHGNREHAVEATRVLVNAGPQVFDELLGVRHTLVPGDEGSVCKVNMVLRRLPRLRAEGLDPRDAFSGTLHLEESYDQMRASYRQAAAGQLPDRPPVEMYCHSLTDDSILGPELRGTGCHTLTLFGLDAPYRLFETDHQPRKEEMLRRYLRALDGVLAEPIEECLAIDSRGQPCIEIKSPQDLESELALNRGNIFHTNPSWFFAEDAGQVGTWGVETPFERVYRCGSSAVRGGAVSGVPGYNTVQCVLAEMRAGVSDPR